MNEYPALRFASRILQFGGQNVANVTIYSKIFAVVHNIVVWAMGIPMILKQIYHFSSLSEMSFTCTITSNNFLCTATTIAFMMKKDVFKDIIQSISDFWPVNHLGETIENQQQRIYNYTYLWMKSFTVGEIILFAFLLVTPALRTPSELPVKTYYFDNLESPFFELVYLWQVVIAGVSGPFIVGFYYLFFFLIAFGYCQMLMLNQTIHNIDLEQADNLEEEMKIFHSMKICIEYHSKILKFFDKINEAYSFILFPLCMSVIPNIFMPLYLIFKTGLSDLGLFGTSLVYISMASFQLGLTCVVATVHTTQSESVANMIYNCNWTSCKISLRLKIAILMMMQRSQKSHELSAGKILILNMELYSALMQLCFSFYTALKSFGN